MLLNARLDSAGRRWTSSPSRWFGPLSFALIGPLFSAGSSSWGIIPFCWHEENLGKAQKKHIEEQSNGIQQQCSFHMGNFSCLVLLLLLQILEYLMDVSDVGDAELCADSLIVVPVGVEHSLPESVIGDLICRLRPVFLHFTTWEYTNGFISKTGPNNRNTEEGVGTSTFPSYCVRVFWNPMGFPKLEKTNKHSLYHPMYRFTHVVCEVTLTVDHVQCCRANGFAIFIHCYTFVHVCVSGGHCADLENKIETWLDKSSVTQEVSGDPPPVRTPPSTHHIYSDICPCLICCP